MGKTLVCGTGSGVSGHLWCNVCVIILVVQSGTIALVASVLGKKKWSCLGLLFGVKEWLLSFVCFLVMDTAFASAVCFSTLSIRSA